MTKIYLIRHAEAEGNLYRIVQGHFNSYITGKGQRQIAALAERFKDIHLDALYSSDLRRTVTTAGAITKYHALPMQLEPRLREIHLGICEGMSFGDMRRLDPEQMDYFNNDPERWHAEGAETFAECTSRMVGIVTEIAERNDGKTVAIVSHGMAIRSLLAYILGVKSEDIPSLPHGDNTAVSCLNYENGSFTVEFYNDNSHLPPELSTFAKQSWWRKESGGVDMGNLSYEPLDMRSEGELYTRCYADAWLAAHGSLKGFNAPLYLSAAKAHCADDERAVLKVIRGEDELIGIVETDRRRSAGAGIGWISLVYLKPEYRGMGLGIQPLGRAITDYQKLGRKAVRLHVSSENRHAVGFYEHYGFRIINREPGAGAPLYLMEKRFE